MGRVLYTKQKSLRTRHIHRQKPRHAQPHRLRHRLGHNVLTRMRKSRHISSGGRKRGPTNGKAVRSPWSDRRLASRSNSLYAITTGALRRKPLRSHWSGRQGGLRCTFSRHQLRERRWSRVRGNSRRREDMCQMRPTCQIALPGLAAGQEPVVSCAARLCHVILMFWEGLSVQEVFIRTAGSSVSFPVPLTCDAGAV